MEEETKTTSAAKVEEAVAEVVEEKKEEAKTENVVPASATTMATPVNKKDKMKACKEKACAFWGKNKKVIIALIILLILIGISYGVKVYREKVDIGSTAIKAKTEAFLKGKVPDGVTISSVTKANGVYKVVLQASAALGGQSQTIYVSADGNEIFQGEIDMNQQAPSADANKQQASQNVPKSDKPDVRLFVMSYCPYGTQMERGILPVLKTLGSSINFTLEFVDYSMHNNLATNDRKELDENMRQYCIQKNQPAVFDAYLGCFLKAGQGTEASCMATAGVNQAQVTSCMAQTDTQFNVTKDFKDQSTYTGQFPQFEINKADNDKYGVQGSPTLVINGVQSNADRDSESLLKAICGAFNNQPKECQTQLSSTAPVAGFEATSAGAPASGGGCASPAAATK
jgi:hypothetical protein